MDSSSIKLSKKKYTQNDLRRLMQVQKSKTSKSNVNTNNNNLDKKIENPLAKYIDGQLNCILCKSVVRSESVWKVHINSKNHREKVDLAKQLKDNLQPPKSAVKRPSESTGITQVVIEKKVKLEATSNGAVAKEPKAAAIPDDFFDSSQKRPPNVEAMEIDEKTENPLPEGFFDDPKKDAKVRNLEYKDPQEEEWLKFQKEIKEETSLSLEIIAGEVETSTNDRQIQDIDEQIYNWQRVLNMERKKEVISEKLRSKAAKHEDAESDDDKSEEEDEDFDEFLDWRAKQIIKK